MSRILFKSLKISKFINLKPIFSNTSVIITLNYTPNCRLYSNWGSKKTKRSIKLQFFEMTNPETEIILQPLRISVQDQGNLVRKLKECGAPEIDVKKAVLELKARKKILEDKELELAPKSATFDRARLEDLLKRRFFYDQSFAIYGGVTGQYDFGPMGCALKSNILSLWRKFFVLEEQMLEVDCSILTPEPVLKASGHVDRFADLMVKDLKNGECFRLDHLIKNHLEKLMSGKDVTQQLKNDYEDIIVKLDGMTPDEINKVFRKFDIKSPITGNDLSDAIEFNLMFSTQIGPTGLVKGFLRPETAQGIFVNFKRLLEFNQGKLPFAAAQIGNAFRNEISPRSGLIRVREFTMAEIEHFCDPKQKDHAKFTDVSSRKILLYSACNQMDGKSAEVVAIGEAVDKKLVANETLGYYIARIHEFLLKIGIKSDRLRFRQHMNNEMAHYACDCWDAECLTSYGWIECVGCADRSAYDLTQHTSATNIKLTAEKKLPEPKTIDEIKVVPNKASIGKAFKKDSKNIIELLSKFELNEVDKVKEELELKSSYDLVTSDGSSYNLTNEMIAVENSRRTIHVEEITPSVVEPSFGIGRIMYSLLEQNFEMRESDEQRCFLTLPAIIAPIKCSILPLSNNPEFNPFVKEISVILSRLQISYKVDDSSGSIGRRYARTDEIAIPYGITIDFDTIKSNTVTLRERDSMKQVRLAIEEVGDTLNLLCNGQETWSKILEKHPLFEQQESK